MDKKIVQQLVEDYLQDSLSEEQEQQLLLVIQKNEDIVLDVLTAMQFEQDPAIFDTNTEKMLHSLQKVLAVDKTITPPTIKLEKSSLNKKWWWVAASVLVLFGLAVSMYLFFQPSKTIQLEIVKKDIVAPTSNRAMVTLADGSTVYLDSLENGTVAQQGNISLVKLANGQIAYQTADGQLIKEMIYNTLSNPRGSKVIDMKLSDGTRVWLNAGSIMKYPLAFVNNERSVELEGEGYFEVAKNKEKPFFVKAKQMKVKVLGTHFNISAYTDDPSNEVTLLEGAVNVESKNKNIALAPLQQAKTNVDGTVAINKNVNIDEVMAWKQDQFYFEETSLKDVMKQVERWYDVSIEIEKGVSGKKFTGKMYRNMSVSEIFKILKELDVNYKIEGKKIIVTK